MAFMNAKRLLCRMTSYIAMPSAKATVLACATLVLLTLWAASNNGASYGIGTTNVIVNSYGKITLPVELSNMIGNPDFSQGYTDWGGEFGWRADQNPQGFAFIDYSQGHTAAPCMKLEPDPYGIGPAQGDPSDSATCWEGFSVQPGQLLYVSFWCKADSDTDHPNRYGPRCGLDGWSGGSIIGSGINIINCSVPIVDGCPTVYWGTSAWTHVEIYGTVPYGVHSETLWFAAWNGGIWGIGDTTGAYYDDVLVAVVG